MRLASTVPDLMKPGPALDRVALGWPPDGEREREREHIGPEQRGLTLWALI